MKNLADEIERAESFMGEVMTALRRYHEAKGRLPANEVELLRLKAEAMVQAANEHQQRVLSGKDNPTH